MILLNGHTLEPAMKFMPESLGVNLEERKSTATMQIGPDAPDIAVGDWLRDETAGCGQGVIWRVKSIDTNYNTDTRLVTMEHIINTLRDAVLFGETTPADITGDPDATTCSAEAAIEYILDRQDLWELASDFPYLSANAYKFNGDTLYAAIESVTGTLEDPCWWYDLSSIPFKLHITEISDEVSCEMREGRNIQTLKKTIDRSRMYTRFYPIGKDNLQLSGGGYISKNESTYGMVAKVETNQKYETEEELEAWAWTRLERHCFPTVTISIGGEDLSRQTGESLDALTLGRKCRVPLPEFGTTIVERIIRISAGDKIKDPDKVTVTLGNELQDIASIMNEVIEEQESGHGGGGRGGMKKQGEDHAWFVDTDDHVGMIAEAIIGRGADGVDWSRVASIIVDGYGIHQRVVRAEGYLVTLEARIDLDEEALRAEFDNFAYSMRSELELSAESLRVEFTNEAASLRGELQMSAASLRVEFANEAASLRSEFTVTAASLRVEFTNEAASLRSEFTVTAASLRSEFADESASVRSLISQEAGRIDLVVTGTGSGATVNAANIALAINRSTGAGEVHIDADHVYINAGGSNEKNVVTEIGGKCVLADVTADYISGKIATLPTLTGIAASFSGNVTTSSAVMGYQIYSGGNGNWTNISDPLMDVRISGPVNNVYTLQYKHATDSGWQDAESFSRAVSGWSVGGGNGKINVTANPQGQTKSVDVSIGGPNSITSNGTYTYKVYYEDASGDDQETGASMSVSVNVPNTITSWGVGGGSGKVNVTANPQGQTKSVDVSIGGPNSITSNGTYTYKVYYEDASGDDQETGASISVSVNCPNTGNHSIGFTNKSGNVATQFICEAACQYLDGSTWRDNPDTYYGGSARSTRTFELYHDGGYVKVRQAGGSTAYASISSGITGLTLFRDPGGNSPCTLYYRYNGSYTSAGNHTWYWK